MAGNIKAVLTIIALCMIASPVKAEEKVWYCEMTSFTNTSIEGAKTYKKETFKIKVSPKEVVFGSGGFTHNLKLPIDYSEGLDVFTASDMVGGGVYVFFYNGKLHYAKATFNMAYAFSARCDDF